VLRRNFRGVNQDAQVLLAKRRPCGQTNFEGAERAIAAIFEFIGDVKMDKSRGFAGNMDFSLAIGKLIARAQGMNAGRRENGACAQGSREK
jgi:hypothetical protein